MRLFWLIAVIGVPFLRASVADAQVTFYTSQAAYNAAVSGKTTTNFTSNGVDAPSYTDGNVTFSSPGGVTTNGCCDYNTPSGFANPNYVALDDAGSANTVGTETFSGGTYHGASFYLSDIYGAASTTLTVNGTNYVMNVTDNANSSFIGFTSTAPITSFTETLDAAGEVDFVGGYTLATALVSTAPEPASWVLMVGGLGIAGMTLRRRQYKHILLMV